MGGKLSRRRLENQLIGGSPAATVEAFTAEAAGDARLAAPVGGREAAAGTAGDPAGRPGRHRVAMAHADAELLLGCIDRRHAGPEVRAVHLLGPQHPMDPGVDHLVAEGAKGRLPRQGIQQRSRQNDLAEVLAAGTPPAPIETGRARKATVTPAQVHQGPPIGGEGAFKVLTVEAMEQGQQRFKRHAAARSSGRALILASPSVRLWTAPQKRHT